MIIRSPRPIDVSPKERIDFLVRLCIRERADAVDTSTRLSLCRFRRNSQALVLRCDGSRHRPQSYKSRRGIVWSFIYQLDKTCTHLFCTIRRRYLRRHFISVIATLRRAPIPPKVGTHAGNSAPVQPLCLWIHPIRFDLRDCERDCSEPAAAALMQSTHRLSTPAKAIDRRNISDDHWQFALSFCRGDSFDCFAVPRTGGVSNKNIVDDDRSIRELTPYYVLCTIINVV